jgi:hypothetical protein
MTMANDKASNPMDRTMDLARVKDVNAAKTELMRVVSAYRMEQDALKDATEASHKGLSEFMHGAFVGVGARIERDEGAVAVLLKDMTRLRQRVYELEHPWRMCRVRLLIWLYARETRFWVWMQAVTHRRRDRA